MTSVKRACVAVAVAAMAIIALPHRARAQELRGTVRDSASSQPIPGVVLMLLDANGTILGRNITNERGEYRIALSAGMQRVRLVRIGFRPREAAIPAPENGISRLDLMMRSLPTMLEPVRVAANPKCPRRKDSDAAFALLEQARAGLLATVVARHANPGKVVLLRYDRVMEDKDRIESQTVQMDSSFAAARSFSSVHSASEFVSRGFMSDSAGVQTFYGPDADVLLDERFTAGYCFRIADSDRQRPNQMGLTFLAADRRRGRTDIEGTLWVDTTVRALRDIEYRYQGLDPQLNSVHPGGRISFREMPNGVVLIDRWNIRLARAESETLSVGSKEEVRQWFVPEDGGGELARAKWPDGYTYHASLGRIQGEARTATGAPAAGVTLRMPSAPYRATTDSAGHFEFSDLLPGPYKITAVDAGLASLGLEIPVVDSVIAVRDSVLHPSLLVRSARDYVADRCLAHDRFTPGATSYLIGRAVAPGGASVAGLRVILRDPIGGGQIGHDYYKLGTNGVFEWCTSLTAGATVVAEARIGSRVVGTATRRLEEGVNVILLHVTLPNP